ncbi:MAG: hypothetical protein ACKONH_00320 [Planctomycetia bacterium]
MTRALAIATFVALVLCGCAVRVNQLDTAKRLIPRGELAQQLEAYAWSLSFNGTELTVYPIEAKGRNFLFATGDGLRLTWDGESVIVIEGFPGALGRFESGIEGDERWYASAGAPVARATCSPRREWRLTASRWGWRQECALTDSRKRVTTQHLVEFNPRGDITLIEATLVPGVPPLRLRKTSP